MRAGVCLLTLLAVLVDGCGGGGGGGGNASPPAAPAISYQSSPVTLTTQVAATLTPTNTGGAAASWSISPTLPAGLTFSTTSGSITGTPTAAAVPASYVVTAENAGGSGSANLTLGIQSVLLDLGHTAAISTLGFAGPAFLSMDVGAHWVLWNYATAAAIAQGTVPCTPATCNASVGPSPVAHAEIAGQSVVIQMPTTLAVLSTTDGSSFGTVSTIPKWWHLASDGSYICGGTSSGLTAWAPNGTVIASRMGDYSKAVPSCAPGVIRVAVGPAGPNVIESVALPSGSSSVGPTFQGVFNTWFVDGSAFLTSVSDTVWVYSNASAQLDFASVSTATGLAGQGSWFWTYEYTSSGIGTLTIYKVGASASPSATYTYSLRQPPAIASGPTIGVLDSSIGVTHVIDLSGATPVDTDYTMPVSSEGAYAAVSASQWVVGNGYGVLLDGTSVNATARYFGYGAAWSIAGGAARAAVATASGKTLFFDATSWQLEGTLDSSNSQIALSSDGTVLAARASGDKGAAGAQLDASVRTFSLPSGAVINTWPYTFNMSPNPWPMDITLAESGALLGQVIFPGNTSSLTYTRQVSASSGGPILWSDTVTAGSDPFLPGDWRLPIRLSADDTLIAVSSAQDATAGTNIYLHDTLATAVPGWAVGWLPNENILQNLYSGNMGSAIYSSSGIKQSSPPLPQLGAIQAAGADAVYDPGTNKIYSLTSGAATWTGPPSTATQTYYGIGAVAGSRVVFEIGSQVVALPF